MFNNQGAPMSTRWHLSYFRFFLCLLAVAMVTGCASRKVVTTTGDQSYAPGATPQARAPVAEAKVSPPVSKEARVAEQPVAPAPPFQPPVPQAGP